MGQTKNALLAYRTDNEVWDAYKNNKISDDTDEKLKEFLLSGLKDELERRGITVL